MFRETSMKYLKKLKKKKTNFMSFELELRAKNEINN